jgi:hypothetical protein
MLPAVADLLLTQVFRCRGIVAHLRLWRQPHDGLAEGLTPEEIIDHYPQLT